MRAKSPRALNRPVDDDPRVVGRHGDACGPGRRVRDQRSARGRDGPRRGVHRARRLSRPTRARARPRVTGADPPGRRRGVSRAGASRSGARCRP